MLVTATNTLVRVLLTPVCLSCDDVLDRPLDGPVCAACWRAVPRLASPCCVRCGDALPSTIAGPWCVRCRRRPSAVTLARSAGRYDGSLRRIIHAFKYGGRRVLAPRLAALMREAGADLLGWRRRGRARPAAPVARACGAASTRRTTSPGASACRSGGSCAGVDTARRRPACPRRSATPTCARLTRCLWVSCGRGPDAASAIASSSWLTT